MDFQTALTLVDVGLGSTACVYLVVMHFRVKRISRRVSGISRRVGVIESDRVPTPPVGVRTVRADTQP